MDENLFSIVGYLYTGARITGNLTYKQIDAVKHLSIFSFVPIWTLYFSQAINKPLATIILEAFAFRTNLPFSGNKIDLWNHKTLSRFNRFDAFRNPVLS